jgi:hypothetical protein
MPRWGRFIPDNFSLKGCKNPAQGNALGTLWDQPCHALKGHKNLNPTAYRLGTFHSCALSGLGCGTLFPWIL